MKFVKLIIIALLSTLLMSVSTIVTAQNDSEAAIWTSTFYNNSYLAEPSVVTRQDTDLAFVWGTGSPDVRINNNYFSARFTASYAFEGRNYRFKVLADDGVRVIIDNSVTLIDTFTDPEPTREIIADVSFEAGIHTIQVDYREITGLATLQFEWFPIDDPEETVFIPVADSVVEVEEPTLVSTLPVTDWTANYYINTNLDGEPSATLLESTPSHNWGDESPLPSIPADNFSAEWTADYFLEGTYEITVNADDGVRVYVDNILFIDGWDISNNTYQSSFSVPAGNYTIKIEYYDAVGIAFLDYNLTAISTSTPVVTSPIATSDSNWIVEYYDNENLAGTPVLVQPEGRVSRTWGRGAPLSTMSPDNFSVRFTSRQTFAAGTYLLQVNVDDGVRVFIDGILYLDEWHINNDSIPYVEDIVLDAGLHQITIEYFERTDIASIDYSLTRTSSIVSSDAVIADDNVDANLEAADARTATVIANILNVRAQPSIEDPIIMELTRGETYTIIAEDNTGNWIQLDIDGTPGWVNTTYVDEFNYINFPIEDETVVDVEDSQWSTLVTSANVNMRRGPGLEYNIIRIIPENTTVYIEASTIDEDWWLVSYGATTGWVTDAFSDVSPVID